jgi:hypothetical protein
MPLAADCRALLTAALGFIQVSPQTPALRALHAWLDNWRGVGLLVDGMRRQGYRVSLREIDAWVASFRATIRWSAMRGSRRRRHPGPRCSSRRGRR